MKENRIRHGQRSARMAYPLWAGLLAAACFASTGAWAQPSAAGASDKIEEVVITAERRAANVQDTPISVIAVTAADLESKGITNVQGLQNATPNLSIGGDVPNGSAEPQFAIRGIGQSSGKVQSEKGVALYIDDVYYAQSIGALFRLIDIDRVEVLRGPQGTLFGRNATGGAIRIITKRPSDKFEADLTAATGSFNRADGTAMVNIPLNDKLAIRLQAGAWTRDGYAEILPNGVGNNSGEVGERRGDVDDKAFRGQLRYKANDNWTFDLSVTHSITDNNGAPVTVLGLNARQFNPFAVPQRIAAYNAYLASIGQPPIVPKAVGVRESDDPRFLSPSTFKSPDNCILNKIPNTLLGQPGGASFARGGGSDFCDGYTKAHGTFVNFDVHGTLSEHLHIRSLTGWQKVNADFQLDQAGAGQSIARSTSDMPSWSEEFQILGDHGRFRWVAGFMYFDQSPTNLSTERTARAVAGVAVCCSGFDRFIAVDTRSYGAFAEANYDLTKRLTITGGLRYSLDSKDFLLRRDAVQRATSGSWDSYDYRATATYHVTDDVMVYATRSTGYKPGGISGDLISVGPLLTKATNGLLSYLPEKNINNEIGIRSEWFDHRVRANLTGYMMRYKDLVINTPDFSDPAGVTVNEQNAGTVDLSGIEAEIVVAPVQGLRLSGSIGTTDIDYVSLNAGSPLFMNFPGVDREMTCPAAVAPLTLAQGCKPIRLQMTPKVTYNLGASYTYLIGEEGALTGTVSYSHVSEQESVDNALNSLRLPAYGLLNLRVEYETRGWTLAVVGTNVLDTVYFTGGSMGRLTDFQTAFGNPGEPAMWGLEFKKHFGE